VEGTVIAGKLLEKSEEESLGGRLGYNAATDVFEDLVAVGVIDPVKVSSPPPLLLTFLYLEAGSLCTPCPVKLDLVVEYRLRV